MSEFNYKIDIDKKVLRILGSQLYGDVPSIISELVQNCYDADATNVWITINTGANEEIIIDDDGIGMSPQEINDRFLNIGYNRREEFKESPSGRKVLGRKGIGKLAVFSLSKKIDVISIINGIPAGCTLDFDKITLNNEEPKAIAENDLAYDKAHLSNKLCGTRIILKGLQRIVSRSYRYIINRLVRAFDVNAESFNVYIRKNINTFKMLKRADLKYTDHLDSIITIGDEFSYLIEEIMQNKIEQQYKFTLRYEDLVNEDERFPRFPYDIQVQNDKAQLCTYPFEIKGWIGTVKEREDFKNLQKKVTDEFSDNENLIEEVVINDNRISVFSRNKIGEYNILPKTQTNRLMDAYIIGEIYADIFENDNLIDMAISNRRGYDEQDSRYIETKRIITSMVNYLERRKEEIQKRRRDDKEEEENKKIKEKYLSSSQTKTILEKRLDSEELNVFQDELLQFGRVVNSSNSTKRIFISHKHDCAEYGMFIVRIFELIGINIKDTIIFTSMPELGVPHSRDIYDYLKDCFRDDLYVVFLFSKSFYDSNICIAETGAAWATNKQYSNFVVDLKYNDIDRPTNNAKRGVNLGDLGTSQFYIDLYKFYVHILNEIGFQDFSQNELLIKDSIKKAYGEYASRLTGLIYIPERKFLPVPICSKCSNPMTLSFMDGKIQYVCSSRSCDGSLGIEIS